MDNNDNRSNNKVTVEGIVESRCKFSHELYGEKFYEFTLGCKRTSEVMDYIPIMISDRLVDIKRIKCGDCLVLQGQFRSFNDNRGEKRKLKLVVFATEVYENDESKNVNTIILDGYICKQPMYRNTPLGREIADLLLAVNRVYGKSDYIPCIAWGRNARFVDRLGIGTHVKIEGRIQSRNYLKHYQDGNEEERTAYEVSVSRIDVVEMEEEQCE